MSRYKPKRLKRGGCQLWHYIIMPLLLVLLITICIEYNLSNAHTIMDGRGTIQKLALQSPVSELTIEPTSSPVSESTYTDPILYYTPDEVNIVAKILFREAGGLSSDTEVACVAWVICNRVDAGYGNTITEVALSPHQFAWVSDTPLYDRFVRLAYDVLNRWSIEKQYDTCDGRVLPSGYLFFHGDGSHNYFRMQYEDTGIYYNYNLQSPYAS